MTNGAALAAAQRGAGGDARNLHTLEGRRRWIGRIARGGRRGARAGPRGGVARGAIRRGAGAPHDEATDGERDGERPLPGDALGLFLRARPPIPRRRGRASILRGRASIRARVPLGGAVVGLHGRWVLALIAA
ncbi:hypothetical protein SCE1572_52650 [Sorangium cellulosum So0157-2]|uniref:Uncharacterized protein n=1 Tax=Sorangium cellulosum So0157-2 TaxID=1254432 RepID=S4YHR0_SORCE|nr:hypothetical protein SCE1572_52650 [Sorangium cellulosum So0157-2]